MKKLSFAILAISLLTLSLEAFAGNYFPRKSYSPRGVFGNGNSQVNHIPSTSHLQFSIMFDSVADADFVTNGVNQGSAKLEDSVGVRIAYGQNYRPNSKWEVELASKGSDAEAPTGSAKLLVNAIMVNNYHEFPSQGAFTPYVTAGLGFAMYTLEDSAEEYDSTQFAYQVGAGVNVPIAPSTDVVLGYRYFDSATPNFDIGADVSEIDYSTHSLELGLRLNF